MPLPRASYILYERLILSQLIIKEIAMFVVISDRGSQRLKNKRLIVSPDISVSKEMLRKVILKLIAVLITALIVLTFLIL